MESVRALHLYEIALKKVFRIFPTKADIMKILNEKGPLRFSEIMKLASYRRSESSRLAYLLQRLLRYDLISKSKDGRYATKKLGRMVLQRPLDCTINLRLECAEFVESRTSRLADESWGGWNAISP